MSSNPYIEQFAVKLVMDSGSPDLLAKLSDDLFANKDLRMVVKLIRNHYLDKSCFPSWDVLISQVVKLCTNKDKSDFMAALLLQIRDKDTTGSTEKDILEELNNFKKLRNYTDRASALVDAIQAKDVATAEHILTSTFDAIVVNNQYDIDENDASNMLGDTTALVFKNCGIAKIDERGGLIQGGLTIIAGEAKAGKSILAEQACGYIYNTYNESVSYHSYEQSVPEIRARLISNYSNVDLGKILAKNLNQEEVNKIRKTQIELFFDNHQGVDIQDFCRANAETNNNEFAELVENHFNKKANRFFFFRESLDWDSLFVKLKLLVTTKNVRTICIDYPWLVPDGKIPKGMSNWEYKLDRIQALKTFSHTNGLSNLIMPAQYDSGSDKLRFVANAVNCCDLCLSMNGKSDDDQTMGTVSMSFKVYRNYLTIPDKPFLEDFKLLKQFNLSRFVDFQF